MVLYYVCTVDVPVLPAAEDVAVADEVESLSLLRLVLQQTATCSMRFESWTIEKPTFLACSLTVHSSSGNSATVQRRERSWAKILASGGVFSVVVMGQGEASVVGQVREGVSAHCGLCTDIVKCESEYCGRMEVERQ